MLWLYGGWKVYISGDRGVYEAVKADYAPGGAREFDADFMANVYERPFEVVFVRRAAGGIQPPAGGGPPPGRLPHRL